MDPTLISGRDERGWFSALEAAAAHGVLGWLARELKGDPEVPEAVQLQLQGGALRNAAAHGARVEALRNAIGALRAGDIDALVLKGPHLVERYYENDPTLRPYGDIDLCVHPEDFRSAIEALEAAGFALLDRNWEFILKDLRGQLHLSSPGGGTVELHWHPVNGLRQRRTLRMRPGELWSAAVPGTVAGEACFVLPPADDLAYLCLHAALHGCNRLLWIIDIGLVADGPELDSRYCAERLRRWRFGAGGYLVLDLARRWTGRAVPIDAFQDLRPGAATRAAFDAFVARWDLAHPHKGARARELFFATAGDGAATRFGLAADLIVPAPGQRDDTEGTGALAQLRRVTFGTAARVRGKLAASGTEGSGAEYVARGDQREGRERYLQAIETQADR